MTVTIRSSIVPLSAAFIAAGLVLSACAPAAAPLPTGAAGVHHHAAPPSPTPTPTPTPTGPMSLVGTTCPALGAVPTVRSLIKANDAVAVGFGIESEPEADSNFEDVAIRQLGGIACYWAGGPIGDGGPEAQLVVDVLPNGSASFTAETSALTKSDDVHEGLVKSAPQWGDASFIDCEDPDGYSGCTIDIEIGSYWLHIVQDPADVPNPIYPLPAALTSFVAATVATVHALPAPGTSWPVPSDAAQIPSSCASTLSMAQVDGVIGPKTQASPEGFEGLNTFGTALLKQASLRECYWEGSYLADSLKGVSVDTLPGSSWAWSALQLPWTEKGETLAPLSGIGDAAFGDCFTAAGECTVYAEVDDSWFDVVLTSSKATLANTELLAKDVVAAAS